MKKKQLEKIIDKFTRLMNRTVNTQAFTVLVLAVILLGGLGARLYKVNNPIADWHSWRQADTASVSRIYLDDGMNLLKPRYYDISTVQTGFKNPEGLRFVEFPIFNLLHVWLVQLLPMFSFEMLGRLVSILSALATTVFIFLIGKELHNKWVGLISAFLYSFIPFNVFFTRVILPDPLAVSFAVGGLWFFLQYHKKTSLLALFFSGILFSLALLAKPHSLFYGLPVVVMLLNKYSLKKIFNSIPLLMTLAVVLIPFLLWRYWITHYGNLVGIPHISWAFNGDKIRFRPSYWRWIYGERLGSMILGTWGLIPFAYGILNLAKKNLFLTSLLTGMFFYLAIIATANVRHDYYQTFIVPAIALTAGYGSWLIWSNKEFNMWIRRGLVIFSIGMMMLMGYDKVKGFYNINHLEIVEVGKVVDETLPKDALVIAPYNGDTAFLYQTNRFGWPIITTDIDDLIDQGADYYVSVNYDDQTNKYRQRFETVSANTKYIILDLHKQL